jgi:outer membrane protein OmpA-like peptidoglycan-associated protein
VHFEQDSDSPTSRSLARLEVLVQDLGDRTTEARHIILEGYTDNREPDALALGKARAFAVQKLLEDRLPGLYFEIIPRGAELPIAPNSTPYGRQQNRRVQVYLAAEESFEPILSGNEAKVEEMAEEAEGEPEEEASR